MSGEYSLLYPRLAIHWIDSYHMAAQPLFVIGIMMMHRECTFTNYSITPHKSSFQKYNNWITP